MNGPMQELTRIALIGTANVAAEIPGFAPLDASLSAGSPEQRLLWQAGSLSLYRQAGYLPQSAALPSIAPDDVTPQAPHSLTPLIAASMAGELAGLAPWFAARMHRAGLRLPHALLPLVFGKQESCNIWGALIGVRGHWLAAQHPRWRLLLPQQPVSRDIEALRRLWDEGDTATRVHALSTLRETGAAQAREWLSAALPKEKAEQRQALIEALRDTLSLDDEPLLEGLLDDRSQAVRRVAANLLLLLPGSALALRMAARVKACLRWTKHSAAEAELVVKIPNELPKDWERDGIVATPPGGEGKRAFWLRQLISAVAPATWTNALQIEPARALGFVLRHEWAEALYAGIVQASCNYHDAEWALALLIQELGETRVRGGEHARLWRTLRRAEREALVFRLLAQGNLTVARAGLIAMSAPWPRSIATAIASIPLTDRPDPRDSRANTQDQAHAALIEIALLRIGDADMPCFAPVIEAYAARLALPEHDLHYVLNRAREIVALAQARQTIMKEIPL
jgi:hypothetical protein